MADPVPIRLAATLMLVRDGETGLEVFMVARHRAIEFASGALVFPGGSVDPGDAALAEGRYDPREAALRVAALRETFEECGVLLAREAESEEWLSAERAAAIGAGTKGAGFAEIVAREKLRLGLDALIPFAHWITPSISAKRFDTAFYIAAAPAGQLARHDGSESVDSVWISPSMALQAAERGLYTIVPVTRLNLALLAESADVASALNAARQRRIVTVEPRAEKRERGWRMHIPPEAGYGVDHFELAAPL
jgi:8-oxo-dGTP pyrophosphatase MutT (NUDIX family)